MPSSILEAALTAAAPLLQAETAPLWLVLTLLACVGVLVRSAWTQPGDGDSFRR